MIALYAEEIEGQWKWPQCKNGKKEDDNLFTV